LGCHPVAVHIYTQTIQRTTQITEQHKYKLMKNEKVWAVPRLCEFYPGICFTTEEKARKNLSQGKKNFSQVKKNLSQSTVCILPKTPTHYKTLTNTHITKAPHTHTHTRIHTLQNNIKPSQYKLKQNAYRESKST
jgi:hypothetical protein